MITEETRIWLRRRALQAQPYEACGFILHDGTIVEIRNNFHDPMRGFLMDRDQLIEKIPNPEVVYAIWHTHPKGSLRPSKSDIDSMFQGAIPAHWKYLIATTIDIHEVDPKTFVKQEDSFWHGFAVT
jgi:proteasome lid subunit RPN8/RPN11